jgi:hypothetical protein
MGASGWVTFGLEALRGKVLEAIVFAGRNPL